MFTLFNVIDGFLISQENIPNLQNEMLYDIEQEVCYFANSLKFQFIVLV